MSSASELAREPNDFADTSSVPISRIAMAYGKSNEIP